MARLYMPKDMPVFTGYDAVFSEGESNAFLRRLALSHIKEVRHQATREHLAACIAGNNLRALCDFDPPYRELTPEDARHCRQATAFFQKRSDLEFGVDRRRVARDKFLEAELVCKQTNAVLRSWSRGEFQFPPDVERVLFRAQRKIAEILGPVPKLDVLKFRFGPGASTLRKKKDAHPMFKLGDAFACSEAFLPLCGEFLAEFPSWVGLSDEIENVTIPVEIHPGRVQFVPKSWKTDRAIVVEPQLNTLFQLGVGDYMANRLKRAGVDLSDQSRNQRLARYGSLTGALATLDLSSASDTISKELVAHLLPLDWYSFLSFGRSPVVELDGALLRQEKFSSMGNGFTFPLESLIFFGLAYGACEGPGELQEVSVYGDDIIVPSHRYRLLAKVLHAVGFTVNPSKSFYSGPFRESCGKDYSMGKDIRPYYQKRRFCCEDAFKLHNFYVRWGDFARAKFVLKTIATHVRLFGPDGFGDGHLLGEWLPKPHRRDAGWAGYTFDTYKLGPRSCITVSPGNFVFPGYSVYARHDFCEPVAEYRPHRLEPDVDFCPAASYQKGRDEGRLRIVLPGTQGYKRVSIYTF